MSEQPTTPISLQRARDVFRARNRSFCEGTAPDRFTTSFDGVTLEVAASGTNLAVLASVAAGGVGSDRSDRFGEVLAWAEAYNADHLYPKVTAVNRPEHDAAVMSVVQCIPGHWEYTDEQFAASLGAGVDGVVDAVLAFRRGFGPAPSGESPTRWA